MIATRPSATRILRWSRRFGRQPPRASKGFAGLWLPRARARACRGNASRSWSPPRQHARQRVPRSRDGSARTERPGYSDGCRAARFMSPGFQRRTSRMRAPGSACRRPPRPGGAYVPTAGDLPFHGLRRGHASPRDPAAPMQLRSGSLASRGLLLLSLPMEEGRRRAGAAKPTRLPAASLSWRIMQAPRRTI
jgi:hypothetical protein